MMREMVTAAIRKAAEKLNYVFDGGFEYRINPTVTCLPAAWLAPPKLIAVKGRNETSGEYKIKIFLMAAGTDKTAPEKESIWAQLERDAVLLYRELENGARVAKIWDLECVPGEFELTNHGELSMEVSFKIALIACSCEM